MDVLIQNSNKLDLSPIFNPYWSYLNKIKNSEMRAPSTAEETKSVGVFKFTAILVIITRLILTESCGGYNFHDKIAWHYLHVHFFLTIES